MDTWPGSTSVSAAEIAATHRRRLIQIVVAALVGMVLASLVGSYVRSDIASPLFTFALIFLAIAGNANYRLSSTARLVADDLASHPGATGWRMQFGLQDGRRLSAGLANFLVSDGEDYRFYMNGKVVERGTLTRVEDGETARTDYRVAEGPRAGQSYEQISTIRDDVLLACAGSPGGARPDGFACTPGSGRILSVWTRVV